MGHGSMLKLFKGLRFRVQGLGCLRWGQGQNLGIVKVANEGIHMSYSLNS